ncbi:hypothetical protein CPC08DRAFT_721403 [Agrocybe pediades]|nr:hypothetical protein CPC08DRAFT_721403 [Agrocybe pediades]
MIQLLSYIVPAVRGNLSLFRGFDSGIGIGELVDTVPVRLKNVAKLALIIFVPAIVVFNEIASFVGVTIRNIPSSVKGQSMIAIGFTGKKEEGLWTFFTSLTLALLVVYQAAVFCLAFFRLVQALLHQRRIENKGSDKAHFINGIGWISAAAKLGAVETVVGFGGGDFGLDMTRRILRMLSRACMCIGVIKGVDVVEDFQAVRTEIVSAGRSGRQSFRRSKIMQYISNPRQSTFRPLSPTAAGFPAPSRPRSNYMQESDEKMFKAPHYTTFSQRQSMISSQSDLAKVDYFASVRTLSDKTRVTVQFDNGTPKLYMRFSKLDVPSPRTFADNIKSRPQSEWYSNSQGSRPFTRSSYYFESEKHASDDQCADLQRPQPAFHNEKVSDTLSYRDSLNSMPSLNGPFEIVNTPVRKLSQETAKPRIVRARSKSEASKSTTAMPTPLPHNLAPETMAVMAFPEPIYYPALPVEPSRPPTQEVSSSRVKPVRNKPATPPHPQPSRPPTQEIDSSRVKSMTSVKSATDSIQAVRELAGQFPGPPAPFQYMPESETHSSWEDESPSSVLYPPIGQVPLALGSPSELAFNNNDGPNNALSPAARSSTILVGRMPVTPEYRAVMSARSRTLSQVQAQQPIDPFEDEEDYQLSSQPVRYAPVGKPLREALKVVVPPFVGRPLAKADIPQSAAEAVTPGTTVSGISMLELLTRETSGQEGDQYLDLGMALNTGTSRQFRPNRASNSAATPTPRRASSSMKTPTTARKYTPKDERFNRIAEWVDTSATVDAAKEQAEAEMPARDNSLQNLHDRGKSIDNLSIPWPKAETDVAGQESEDHETGGTAKKPQLSRLKTVGRVPNQKTPSPPAPYHHPAKEWKYARSYSN